MSTINNLMMMRIVSCVKNLQNKNTMHENLMPGKFVFMHENEIFMHENGKCAY